jgi:hypothetical protein
LGEPSEIELFFPDLEKIFVPELQDSFITEYCKEYYLKMKNLSDIKAEPAPADKPKVKTKNNNPNLTLSDVFKSQLKYKIIMEKLVSKNLCQPHIYYWKDEAGGNKKLLIAIIKTIQLQGFLERKITNSEIEFIAKNTFNHEISIDSIKKTKANSINIDYIPLESAISDAPIT